MQVLRPDDGGLSGIARLVTQTKERRRLGAFTLSRRLGKGSFAPVWLAHETYGTTTLRSAAVKLFNLPEGHAPLEKTRVLQAIVAEAGALCRVEHPNVVRFYALPIDERMAVMGLAMEYVDGISLEQRLEAEQFLPLSEMVAVGKALASALAAVHSSGLVHRDVKPANIVSTSSVYKLIDFGVAAAGASRSPGLPVLDLRDAADLPIDTRLSSFGSLVSPSPRGGGQSTVALELHCGTMGYIDPTCLATGAPATPASDLYALGATLFRCLVGCVPALVDSPGRTAISSAILRGTRRPPSLAKLVPSVPKSLAALVDALLEPERARRPASAASVLERLEQIDWLLNRSSPANPVAHTRESEAPSELKVEVRDGIGLCALGSTLVVVHPSDARRERARFFHDRLEQLALQVGGDVACMLVIPDTADPPDTETRLEHARRFARHTALRRFVTVSIGDEFWHKVVQGITHGMNQAHGSGCVFVSTKSISEGITALFEPRPGQGNSPEPRVNEAVDAVCRQLGVVLARRATRSEMPVV